MRWVVVLWMVTAKKEKEKGRQLEFWKSETATAIGKDDGLKNIRQLLYKTVDRRDNFNPCIRASSRPRESSVFNLLAVRKVTQKKRDYKALAVQPNTTNLRTNSEAVILIPPPPPSPCPTPRQLSHFVSIYKHISFLFQLSAVFLLSIDVFIFSNPGHVAPRSCPDFNFATCIFLIRHITVLTPSIRYGPQAH